MAVCDENSPRIGLLPETFNNVWCVVKNEKIIDTPWIMAGQHGVSQTAVELQAPA